MPHWDEGTLQAWIDGPRSGLSIEESEAIAEHVATCEACTARVAELRADSVRTAALLGSAEQDEVPPFAAVLARAESQSSAGGPVPLDAAVSEAVPAGTRGSPTRGWSATRWAASIVMALGAGWLANDLFRRGAIPAGPAAEPAAFEALYRPESAEPDIEIPAPPEAGVEVGAARERSAADGVEAAVAAPMAERPLPAPAPQVSAATRPTTQAVRPTDPVGLPPARFDTRTRQIDEASEPVERSETTGQGAGTAEVLRGRVVDAATQRPLEAVQVFIPELGAGALSLADGSFALDLRGQPLDSATDDLTIEAQLIGYSSAIRRLQLGAGNTAALEFALRPTAIQVDEMDVTSTRRPRVDEPEAADTDAATVGIDFEASGAWAVVERAADATLRNEAGLPVLPESADVTVRRHEVSGVEVTRIEQRLDDGTPVTVFVAPHPMSIRNRPDATSFAQRQLGDRWIAAVGVLDEPTLRAWLERIR